MKKALCMFINAIQCHNIPDNSGGTLVTNALQLFYACL